MNSIILIELNLIILIIIFLLMYLLKNNKYINEDKLHIKRIKQFPSYLSILEHYMENSYTIIYKERIMVYSLEATRLSENELNIVVKDYLSLTLKFLGPHLVQEFIKLYGDIDTLYFIIGQKFYERYEDDKIREESTNEIMNSDFSDEEK